MLPRPSAYVNGHCRQALFWGFHTGSLAMGWRGMEGGSILPRRKTSITPASRPQLRRHLRLRVDIFVDQLRVSPSPTQSLSCTLSPLLTRDLIHGLSRRSSGLPLSVSPRLYVGCWVGSWLIHSLHCLCLNNGCGLDSMRPAATAPLLSSFLEDRLRESTDDHTD